MVITNNKIKVTEQDMFDDKLSRMLITGEIGIPASPTDKEPVEWKDISLLEDEDFNKIEDYYLHKHAKTH